jgi:hypothetical protein
MSDGDEITKINKVAKDDLGAFVRYLDLLQRANKQAREPTMTRYLDLKRQSDEAQRALAQVLKGQQKRKLAAKLRGRRAAGRDY